MIQFVIRKEIELILSSSLFLQKVLPKSISVRFFWILTAPVILSQLVFGVLFFGKYTESVMKMMANQIAGDIWVVSNSLDFGYPDSGPELQRKLGLTAFILKNTHLKKIGIERNGKVYRLLRNALYEKGLSHHYIRLRNNNIITYITAQNGKDLYKISFPRRNMYTRIIPIVLGWGLASSMVLLIIAYMFLKNQLRPIKKLVIAVDEFGRGIDTNNFKPEGAAEVRRAGMAFCDMKANFRAIMNNRMKTLAGISHDLRTPLTKIKLQLSLLDSTEEIELLKKDVDIMAKITENFTLHSANQNKEMFAHWNLGKFLNELAKEYAGSNFKILIEGDRAIEVYIKYISLKRAFGNIISNAKKYAENLYIYFMEESEGIILYFEDDGPGIAPDVMDDIFSPFVCGNQARTHDDAEIGVGLGLSIVRDVITDHGGKVSASRSREHGGAKFTVTLPMG
ncbi:MAG: HAMP domain-containing histidine kinase [Holosporales bacterium]|jgi:two-component system osmolarity sensor histidine kinase EnvZ|nr:HAMP domain-containing histidine kinase [Holosporales bacterium]